MASDGTGDLSHLILRTNSLWSPAPDALVLLCGSKDPTDMPSSQCTVVRHPLQCDIGSRLALCYRSQTIDRSTGMAEGSRWLARTAYTLQVTRGSIIRDC